MLDKSAVAHADISFKNDVEGAVKGKKSLEKMQEAVDEIKGYYFDKIAEIEELFNENISLILSSESEYPGLYHDKRNIALKPVAEVEAIIESRVNDFKLKQLEKAETERKAKEVKPEVEPVQPKPVEPIHQPQSFGGFGSSVEQKQIRKIYLEIDSTKTEAAIFARNLSKNDLVTKLDANFNWGGGF